MAHELSQSIIALADQPTQENADAFYAAFAASRVGVRVPPSFGAPPPGQYVTKGGQLPIPTGKAPDGSTMFVVLADVDDLLSREPTATILELAASDVLKLAQANGAGVVVKSTLPGRAAWAAISKDFVPRLLSPPGNEPTNSPDRGVS